jgi:hypothetical protein
VPCCVAGADCTVNAAAGPDALGQLQHCRSTNQREVDTDVEMTEADEQQQQEAASAAAEASSPPAWADLPEGLLGRVAACLGGAVAAVTPMYTACRCTPLSWKWCAGCSGKASGGA